MKKPAQTAALLNKAVAPATVESALASVNAAAATKTDAEEFLPRATDKQVKAAKARAAKASQPAAPAELTPHLIAIRDNSHIVAIEDRRHTPAIEVVVQQLPTKLTAAEKRKAKSEQDVRHMTADHMKQDAKVDHTPANKAIGDMLRREMAASLDIPLADVDKHVTIPTTGYQGPMRALRDRVKAGAYVKAANGQPSCGDEVARILGALEPIEVIRACLTAMDITNPYGHLNVGQQSMNLRNKLRGQLKRGEIGMGVLREAVEVTMEARPAKSTPAPAQVAAPTPEAAPAPAAKPTPAKAKRTPKPAK